MNEALEYKIVVKGPDGKLQEKTVNGLTEEQIRARLADTPLQIVSFSQVLPQPVLSLDSLFADSGVSPVAPVSARPKVPPLPPPPMFFPPPPLLRSPGFSFTTKHYRVVAITAGVCLFLTGYLSFEDVWGILRGFCFLVMTVGAILLLVSKRPITALSDSMIKRVGLGFAPLLALLTTMISGNFLRWLIPHRFPWDFFGFDGLTGLFWYGVLPLYMLATAGLGVFGFLVLRQDAEVGRFFGKS